MLDLIDYYVRTFQRFSELSPFLGEALCWTVVRPHEGKLTVEDVVSRLGGDPATLHRAVPLEADLEDMVVLEQRDDAVVIVEQNQGVAAEAVGRLSQGARVHSVIWLVNNYNFLYYGLDGTIVTEMRPLSPEHRWGTDPDALNDHLGALLELSARQLSETDPGPFHDWQTQMATMESLTGERLSPEWFQAPQWMVRLAQ